MSAAQFDMLGMMAAPMRFEPISRVAPSEEAWPARKVTEESAREAGKIETIRWGKSEFVTRAPSFELSLWDDGKGWREATSYALGQGGSYRGFGADRYETREAAMLATFRKSLSGAARTLANGQGGAIESAHNAQLAAWIIDQCPADRFGGVDLAAEFEAMKVVAAAREKRRGIALRAVSGLNSLVEAITKELGCYAYSGGWDNGLLKHCVGEDFPGKGRDPAGHAKAWPADWVICGHAPDALEIAIYPRDGQTDSPTVKAAFAAMTAQLSVPVTIEIEKHGYPLKRWTWDEEA